MYAINCDLYCSRRHNQLWAPIFPSPQVSPWLPHWNALPLVYTSIFQTATFCGFWVSCSFWTAIKYSWCSSSLRGCLRWQVQFLQVFSCSTHTWLGNAYSCPQRWYMLPLFGPPIPEMFSPGEIIWARQQLFRQLPGKWPADLLGPRQGCRHLFEVIDPT